MGTSASMMAMTMMPAKNDSFIESMKVSVGLSADISRRLPRLSTSGIGAVFTSAATWLQQHYLLRFETSNRDLRYKGMGTTIVSVLAVAGIAAGLIAICLPGSLA